MSTGTPNGPTGNLDKRIEREPNIPTLERQERNMKLATTQVYRVTDIRVLFPEGKVAEKNPDRFATVVGTAFHTIGSDGKVSKDALSITSKPITKEMATNPLFAIDLEAGTLTLAENRQGRAKAVGATVDVLAERLAALRK